MAWAHMVHQTLHLQWFRGQCMLKMAEYVDGTEPFYSLAEACQDTYLDITMAQSLEQGVPIRTKQQIWAT